MKSVLFVLMGWKGNRHPLIASGEDQGNSQVVWKKIHVPQISP